MDTLLRKILLTAIVVFGFVVLANSALAVPAVTPTPLVVEFQTGPSIPLFSEANFLPGESTTRWVKVTNNSGVSQTVIIDARNFSNPLLSDDLSRVLEITITENGNILYGPNGSKLLSNFYSESGDPSGGDNKTIILSDLADGNTTQYDITISFPSGTGNDWQGMTTGFDVAIGFKLAEPQGTTSPLPSPLLVISGGGGGGGGSYYFSPVPTPIAAPSSIPRVAGASTTNGGQTGGQAGGSGGFVAAAETTGPTESISPTPAAPAVAGESTCSPIWWWFFGYVLLLVILGVTRRMGRKVFTGGIVLRIVLLIAALLWWWFEPCGPRFWVWPVLMLIIFLASLRFYLRKSSADGIPT